MGGPYISLEQAKSLLERWLEGEPFFGKIVLECENNQIFRIEKDATFKKIDVDRVLGET